MINCDELGGKFAEEAIKEGVRIVLKYENCYPRQAFRCNIRWKYQPPFFCCIRNCEIIPQIFAENENLMH